MRENKPKKSAFIRWMPTAASALLAYAHVLAAAEAARLGYGGYCVALAILAFAFFNVTGILAMSAGMESNDA